jgi:hypothetical protein
MTSAARAKHLPDAKPPEFLQPHRDWQVILVAGQQPMLPGSAQGCQWGVSDARFALEN